jgi:hypothetical protein
MLGLCLESRLSESFSCPAAPSAHGPVAGCPWALGGPRLTWCVLSATRDPSIPQRPTQVFTSSDESEVVLGIFIDENTIILTADPATVDKN